MNLRYIVPALGILASTSGALFAENVGGLSIGGYVDTIGQASHTDDGDNTGADIGAPVTKAFSAAIELRVGYKVGDQVTAQIDLEGNNSGAASDTDADGNLDSVNRDIYLEQAYINYAIAESFSLTTGKFTTYAGWVAADADGLFRINAGPIVACYGGELLGVAGNFAPSEDLGISVFVVNGLDIWNDDSANDSSNDHLAVAVDAVYKVKDVGSFNLEGGYDMVNSDETNMELGFNATIKLASYEPLTLGAEVIYTSQEFDLSDVTNSKLGVMVMANHTIPSAPFPMSGTVMIQHLDESTDPGVGSSTTDTTNELALALLTNPTGDSHFGVNAEVSYEIFTPDGVVAPKVNDDDETTLTVSLEAIAVIP